MPKSRFARHRSTPRDLNRLRMLWLSLSFVLFVVIAGILVNLVSEPIGDLLRVPRNLGVAVVVVLLLSVAAVVVYNWRRRHEVTSEFQLLAPADQLQPADFGFQIVEPGVVADTAMRPYHPDAYIPRVAVHYADRYRVHGAVVHDEEALLRRLQAGRNLLLVGHPTEGKTRTLFEIARRLRGFTAVRLKYDQPPSDEAIALLQGHNVLLILDDLNYFTNLDLLDTYRNISNAAALCALAATCRDGYELSDVRAQASSFQRILESFRGEDRFVLRAVDDQEKSRLQSKVGNASDRAYPTLGAICMHNAFDVMRERFEDDRLDHRTKDCLRALQLLARGRVEPFTRERVRVVLREVFDDTAIDNRTLRASLGRLGSLGFILSPGGGDPIVPEAAYVAGPEAEFYYRYRAFGDDLPRLQDALMKSRDLDGLNMLAVSYYFADDHATATEQFSNVIEQFGNDPGCAAQVARALFSRGVIKDEGEDREGAIADYTAVIKLPDAPAEQVAKALVNRGVARGKAGYPKGEMADYTAVIELPDAPAEPLALALVRRAIERGHAGDLEGAMADYTAVIERPDAPAEQVAMANRAIELWHAGALFNHAVERVQGRRSRG